GQKPRAELYEEAQAVFKEQAPWYTIAHAVQLKPVRKEVVDFKLSPFGRHTFYGVNIRGCPPDPRAAARPPRARRAVCPFAMFRFALTRLALIVPTFLGIT